MSIYKELGVKPIINAAGTYTALGGSRMSGETLHAMAEAANDFVPIRELQQHVNEAIAELTHNEAAYVSNGAATGLYLAIAAAIERLYGRKFFYFAKEDISSANVVLFKGHRNPYDLVIGYLGAQYRELGFPNLILPSTGEDLEDALNEKTAAVYYAATGWAAPGALPLEEVICICKRRGVPLIVDAAAQLPPVENLWRYSQAGVDVTLFSGGKDICGPQASGLMVGSKAFLDHVAAIGFPNYGIGRMMKVGREEMVGLYAAIRQYVRMDHEARYRWCEEQVRSIVDALKDHPRIRAKRSFPNEAGQPIARAFVEIIDEDLTPGKLQEHLRENDPPIYTYTENQNGIFINPMSLREGETGIILRSLAVL